MDQGQASLCDWRTPDKIMDRVRMTMGSFHDPCNALDNPTRAKTFWTEGAEHQNWTLHDRIFCNVPWSRKVPGLPSLDDWSMIWADYTVMNQQGRLIAVCPASVNSKWWHENVWAYATAIFFPKGRIEFDPPPGIVSNGSNMGDSAVVHYGVDAFGFRDHFEDLGKVIIL